jgi:hypothetical protein
VVFPDQFDELERRNHNERENQNNKRTEPAGFQEPAQIIER